MSSSYWVTIELDGPKDVNLVAVAIGLALANTEVSQDLVVNRLEVQRQDA